MKNFSSLKTNPDKVRAWQQRSRKPLQSKSGLKAGSSLKSHKPMRKVGKVGKANIASVKKIKEYADRCGLDYCEVCPLGFAEFAGVECVGSFALTTAHRFKRAHYKGDVDALSNPKTWVKACISSHDLMEQDAALTEKVFCALRGDNHFAHVGKMVGETVDNMGIVY